MSDTLLPDVQRAVGRFTGGDFAAALEICEAVLARAPRHVEAAHLKAMALGRLGRTDEAVSAYRLAAKIHPQKAAVFGNLGNALSAAGRYDEAVEAYRQAIKHDGAFVNAWCNLGIALNRSGDPAGAEQSFQQALRLDPRHTGALNNLGVLYSRQRRHEEAIGLFSAALEIDPELVSARINRGGALREKGRIADAIADHALAAERAPGLAESHYQLAASLAAAGDFAAAGNSYRRALEIDPKRIDAHRDFARSQWELGRHGDAFDTLDAAIARSGPAELLVLRGELSYLAGNPQAAGEAARRALAESPHLPSALGLLARVTEAGGDGPAAVVFARRACELAPDDFALRHSCAEIELANGFFTAAAERLAGEAPLEHRQKHLGLWALALRALGDERYRRIYDYDRFTAQIAIDPPEGFSSVEAFNAALRGVIQSLHVTKNAPIDQTLYGGTQSKGRLWDDPHPLIQAYVRAMLAAARRFVERLPDDPDHPFLARKSLNLACAGAWSVILSSGGGHTDHIHPAGWISGCYYIHVPQEVMAGDRAGHLRLGASAVRGLDLPAERWIKPIAGTVVFFPSCMWHGVERFSASEPRMTAPFDLASL